MRLGYFIHGVTGKKTPSMISIERRYPAMGKFTRLSDLRWSLTHWTLLQTKRWWLMLFPYGGSHWFVSRKNIDIACPLFAFAWRKR